MANIKLILVLLSAIFLSSQISCKEAILHVSNGGSSSKEYCLVYNPKWSGSLSETLEDAVGHPLFDLTQSTLCDAPSGVPPEEAKDAALVVMRGRCELSQKAGVAQDMGAAALLVASKGDTLSPPRPANRTAHLKPRLPLALMWHDDLLDAQRLFGGKMQARLYTPPQPRLDPSLAVMLLIAVTTVVLGGLWSGMDERERLTPAGGASGAGRGRGGAHKDTEESLDSPLKVLMLLAMMCGMLLLMYFFYSVLVYVVIVMFFVGSATAMFVCLDALLACLGVGTVRLPVHGRLVVCVRSALLAAGCVGVAAVWAAYMKELWIWPLQNVLGVAFCVVSIRTIQLSSFRICTLLFGLLLAYDVFFVFITRFFTADGVSIMEQVALGGGGGVSVAGAVAEAGDGDGGVAPVKLPVVMMVPRLLGGTLCGTQFSILGYGDMVVPGLLVAYCSRFDQQVAGSRWVYFLTCCVAYFLGMLATLAAMLLSEAGQPALLYLVPFTLASCALVAWCRGEMRHFWAGSTDDGKEGEELTTAP